jgi:rod shape determining protein RodA
MGKISARLFLDWPLLIASLLIVGAGLVTMNSIGVHADFFSRQVVWLIAGLFVFFILLFPDYRFLRTSRTVMILYGAILFILTLLFALGSVFKGAQSWFDLGLFAFQPSDPAKIVLIILLAKYFSRRHVEIADIRHILISGGYALLIALLVLMQPDFGSAVIIFLIWLGMVVVSGISLKHLGTLVGVGAVAFFMLWNFAFAPYQKDRIMTFIHPLTDITGAGYNAYQSMVAVGSGQLLGKGVGYGSQSRLSFLPEYETDFIFAAFAEEWGFIGVVLLFSLFGIVVWRVLRIAREGETNFESLFAAGVAIMFIAHFAVHVGMNMGILPITGTTIPFMSYGGSNLMTNFIALGILMGMAKYRRLGASDPSQHEIIPTLSEGRAQRSRVV